MKTSMRADLLSNLSSQHLTISIFIILKLCVTRCDLKYHEKGFNKRKCIFRNVHLDNASTNNQKTTQIQNRKRSNRQQSSEYKQMSINQHRNFRWHFVRNKNRNNLKIYSNRFGIWSNLNEAEPNQLTKFQLTHVLFNAK